MEGGTGTAIWGSAAWQTRATAWLDAQLAAAGLMRTGAVEQTHLRPWATTLKAATTGGVFWLKAAGPCTAYEVGLYELLQRVVPAHVLAPLATDTERGWLVLPDGGPSLGHRLQGDALLAALATFLPRYGRMQRDLAPMPRRW